MILELIPQIEDEDDRDADVGGNHAAPVDLTAREGGIVLTDDDNRAEDQSKIDAKWEAGCAVRQDIEAEPLCLERTAEPVMADGDAEPDHEARHARELHEPLVGRTITNQGTQEGQETEGCREQQCIDWHTAFVDLGKAFWRFAGFGHCVEHTRGSIQARVAAGKDGREDNEVHERGSSRETGAVKRQRERAYRYALDIRLQEIRIGVRQQEADDDHGADVKEQDTPENVMDRLWHCLMRILAFAGGNPDELRALEGECSNHRDCDDRARTADEWCITSRPVAGTRGTATDDTRDQQNAEHEEQQDHADLDAGKYILALTVSPRGQVVQDKQYDDEDTAPDDRGDIREPELHDECAGDDFNRQRDGPVQPIVPADGETHGRIDEATGVGAERTGYRQVGGHLAQTGHDEINHDADDAIGG